MTRILHRYVRRYGFLTLLTAIGSIILCLALAVPSIAHWDDLATAEISIDDTEVQMNLMYPTELTAFADNDNNGSLSVDELDQYTVELRTFFEQHIEVKNSHNYLAILTIQPFIKDISPNAQIAPSNHTTLRLIYTWTEPTENLAIAYRLFPPNAPEASCLATILQAGQVTTHVFTPDNNTLVLPSGTLTTGTGEWVLTLIGAFLWGAVHSLSPGHGKTLVGAYLVGERATSRHALFLALTTTITHTIGVFTLGFITLAATRYVVPEQLYPWLSLISGSLIIAVGFNLVWQRSQQHHDHDHSHPYPHTHHHSHSHSLSSTDTSPVTWRRLLLLGLSAGLVPCPAALVLLLGAIALGHPMSGLMLVLAFSVGLASVLTGLGVLLVSAKQVFNHVPILHCKTLKWLPIASALGITIIGIGMSTRSLLQLL